MLTLVLGTLAAAVAWAMHDVINALTIGYDLLVGSLFVPIIAAMISRRSVPAAALISIVVSSVVVVALILSEGVSSTLPVYGGLGASLAAYAGVTLVMARRAAGLDARDSSRTAPSRR